LTKTLIENGVGCIAFSPLAQGFLSDKYLNGIPKGTRVSENSSFSKNLITKNNLKIINNLNSIAKKRGQSLSQMALAWVLNNKAVTSALIGVRTLTQLQDNLAALNNLKFSKDELKSIDKKAKEGKINLWAPSSSY
jgi:L-glyceraldehyde 3-phosphate reductase